MFDWFMENLVSIVTLFLVLVVGVIVWQVVETVKHCSRWEERVVHQEAYTQYVWTGKLMVPIYHPAGDYNRSVCVEPK